MPKYALPKILDAKGPETIRFYSGRPGAPDVICEELTPKQLSARLNFTYSASYFCDPGYCKEAFGGLNGQPKVVRDPLFVGIALADLGDPFGVCAVAEEDIPAGKIVGYYTGVLRQGVPPVNEVYEYILKKKNIPELVEDSHISAREVGSLGRFIAHLPKNNPNIAFEYGCRQAVAFENIACYSTLLNGVPVVEMRSMSLIKKGCVLGFDYGLGYWFTLGQIPSLMTPTGELIPRSIYKYKGDVEVVMDSGDGLPRVLCEQSVDDIKSVFRDAPLGINFRDPSGPFRYMSVYALMTQCAEKNLLSSYYGRLSELSFFARSLKQCCECKGVKVDVASYWSDPGAREKDGDACENFSAYAVDTVVSCASKATAEAVHAMLKPLGGRVKPCRKTHVLCIQATNTEVKALNDLIEGMTRSMNPSGQGHVAALVYSGCSVGNLSRELKRQVRACRARLFPQTPVEAIKHAREGLYGSDPVEVASVALRAVYAGAAG